MLLFKRFSGEHLFEENKTRGACAILDTRSILLGWSFFKFVSAPLSSPRSTLSCPRALCLFLERGYLPSTFPYKRMTRSVAWAISRVGNIHLLKRGQAGGMALPLYGSCFCRARFLFLHLQLQFIV